MVRKLDNPSCWRLAPLQGFSDKMQGPRTHERGKFVQTGIQREFAWEELFDMKSITQIWLCSMKVSDRPGAKGTIAMCQYCARHYAQLRGDQS